MLTRAEFKVLSTIHKPTPLRELSTQLGLSRARVSTITRFLETKTAFNPQ